MAKGIFIIGTDTDVGKTVVTAGIMYLLRSKGYNACYFKAALSGAVENLDKLIPGDTSFVKYVSSLEEKDECITPYIFKTPVSPHLAANLENKPIDIKLVKESFYKLKEKYDFIVAEGSGGIVCPLINEENNIYILHDLIKELNLDVIIVARAGVGTINHTVITVKYAESLGIVVKGIIINGYEENNICHEDNIKIIKSLTKVPIIGVIPKLKDVNIEELKLGNIKEEFQKNISVRDILNSMTEV